MIDCLTCCQPRRSPPSPAGPSSAFCWARSAAPLLIYAVGVADPHVAIGTSAAAVAAIAAISLVNHARRGRVKWRCALVFAFAGVAGSALGSSIAKRIDGDALLLAFAGAMIAIAASMFRAPKHIGDDPDVRLNSANMRRLAPIGAMAGGAAGFFGIGGGFLIVPGLMAATGMTMAHASASSLVSVFLFGATTASNYACSGFVDGALVLCLLVGGAIGGYAGGRIAKSLDSQARLARRLFATMIIIVALFVGTDAAIALLASPQG